MATIIPKKNKSGEVISYKVMVCVGRDEATYKQIWRTKTFKRPEGMTPAKEKKEIERQADAWAEAQKAEYDKNHTKTVDKDKITFESFVKDHWMPDCVEDGQHKATTVAFYRNLSKDVVSYFGPKVKLKQIDVEAVKKYLKYLRTEAQTQDGKPLGDYTIQHYFNVLRNILEYATHIEFIGADPCRKLRVKEKPHREKKDIDFLAPEDARRFIECLQNEPLFWRAYFTLLILTGVRRGESVGLQWKDISAKKKTLTICRNVTPDPTSAEKYVIGSTKSGKKREVPLTDNAYKLLMELKSEREEQLQVKLLPSTFIFCRDGDPGRPLYPTVPTQKLKRIVKKYDLPNISPHDLRHTAATLALASGATLKELQELLGHSDVRVLLENYSGIIQEMLNTAVNRIDEMIM